ncbi:hypothetical protein X743_32330 [Mesorhizobium sp. LNHC252B00]|nr:hypothetical protein X743_32330 [Mesorhizobium sp. LNHC252B00]
MTVTTQSSDHQGKAKALAMPKEIGAKVRVEQITPKVKKR